MQIQDMLNAKCQKRINGTMVCLTCAMLYHGVTGTGTMVTDGFPLGLVWFQDTSLVAVALLCRRYRLIPSLFYVWFRDTRLCLFRIVFRKYHLILRLFEALFQGIV